MRANSRAAWNPEFADQVEAIRRQHGSHGRGRERGRGRGPFGPEGFAGGGAFFGPAWGPVFGPGRGRGRGPRVRRGDVRAAILDILAGHEGDLNGYQVIQQIADRTGGAWRPSPGSVYPTIAQLEDEELLETVAAGGRKVLRLTAAGREHVAAEADQLAAVWQAFDEDAGDPGGGNLKQVIAQTMTAVWQLAATGTPDQQERAAAILAETRRKLYGVLADGPEE